MEPQPPAEGILLKRFSSALPENNYHIECDCGVKEHSIQIWVDRIDGLVSVDIDVTVYTPWELQKSLRKRLRSAAKLLFTGVLELEHSLILRRQVALNLAAALKDAVDAHTEKRDP